MSSAKKYAALIAKAHLSLRVSVCRSPLIFCKGYSAGEIRSRLNPDSIDFIPPSLP
jgi:hypothetical protein